MLNLDSSVKLFVSGSGQITRCLSLFLRVRFAESACRLLGSSSPVSSAILNAGACLVKVIRTCKILTSFHAVKPTLFFKSSSRLLGSGARMSKQRILVTRNDFPKESIDLLTRDQFTVELWDEDKNGPITREKLLKWVPGASAIYCRPGDVAMDGPVLEAAGPSLKVISTFSVGVDHVDLAALKAKGVRLGYTPDVLTEATAELTVAVLLATSRRLLEANQAIRDGKWTSPWGPLTFCGPALKGSTVGVFGFGRIGQSVARKLKAFDVAKIVYSSDADKPEGKEMGAIRTSFEDMLKQSDFLVVTCALTDKTRGIFNKEKFQMMKPTAIFVNSSRGGVVDQDALIDALEKGTIRAAGLDVMTPEPLPSNHKLLSLKNCVVVPHIGSATFETRKLMADLVAKNILAALTGEKMPAEYPL